MNNWPTLNQSNIFDFIDELKNYFGTPITIEKINSIAFNGENSWQIEGGSYIASLIDISTRMYNQSDFDKIVNKILNHYNNEFKKVDFIAKLKYLTEEEGGRNYPVKSGYRPHINFDFSEIQTSGQQIFIDKETVFPGDTVNAKIKILSPDCFAGCLSEGIRFEFREGPRVVGTGEIKYIVNDKLEKE